MAYLMTDVAAGGQAALQLQQSMAAAPNVQQAEANKMQEQQLKLQQEQATLEKTRLGNLMTDAGYQRDVESTAKLKAWYESPEGQASDDVKKIEKAAFFKTQAGLVVEGAALSKEAATLEGKKLADKQKSLDLAAQSFGNVFGVIDSLKTSEQVNNFFKEMETKKPEEYKTMVDMIGPTTFAGMTPDEKKRALKNLTLNAKGQIGVQLKAIEIQKAEIAAKASTERAQIAANRAIYNRDHPPPEKESVAWKNLMQVAEGIETKTDKKYQTLQDRVDAAQTKLDKTRFFDSSEKHELGEAIKARDTYRRKQLNRILNVGDASPKFTGKEEYLDTFRDELNTLSKEDEPPPPKEGGTKDVTKNKGGDSAQEAKALAWAKANPNDPRAAKYLKEKAGGEGGTHTPAPTAAPTAPAAAPKPTPADKNPYVDSKGRPTGKAPTEDDTGSPLSKTIAPAVSGAAKSVGGAIKDFTADAQKKFLLSKLADGTATPADKERARRLGLM